MTAVHAGCQPAVDILVEEGVDLETKGEEESFEGFTALHRACYESRPDFVRFLVSKGAGVNAEDKLGRTPLTYAAYEGPPEVFEHLLSKGADLEKSVDNGGVTALHVAAAGNQKEIAEMILDRGMIDVDVTSFALHNVETPLHFTAHCDESCSVVRDSDAVAELLISRGADVNARDLDDRTLLHKAASYGCVKVLQLALDRGAEIDAVDDVGETPLMCTGHMIGRRVFDSDACAKVLLDRGADVNATDAGMQTVVHKAATNDCVKVLQLALDRGANVEARDDRERTPLHCVLRSETFRVMVGNDAAARLLLARGADVNARITGEQTILHVAAEWGRVNILQVALDHGADVNASDRHGENALHMLVWPSDKRTPEGTMQAAQMLVTHGINVQAENDNERTPLQMAEVAEKSFPGLPILEFLRSLEA
uniref:Uncharacterized protein n=1 Tax=Chromera velia CCMP2878 TaxID=1169474 RepID=A0A0G4GLD4_9ALVE|mmetsp:Transcript_32230/g.63965  ORF Transcript_32230/g.63965 Transcript_32230/m.63965 type:complete len:425 (-) Transcript_32230:45-1319(-)|eukprot:Cvel_697.t1-p1 / transcript=Cvel_697.t1 / gene=Cvel_697 / organism=Chromera_velia_CCMP2878 / gene_product=Ankyrin-3, putative / transcript_product=Ankyrin-3, putative / location=Cvel_scaffold21:146723-147994(+) / protein_length=424 / sequence_SO=supercontig / SO=protein_coding / is_pseudo=false